MKKLFLSIILAGAGFSAQAQDYYHSLGLGFIGSINHVIYSDQFENVDSWLVGSAPLAAYKACLGFDISRKQTFGITAYPSLGGSIGVDGINLSFALPVAAELYFGDVDDNHFKLGLGATYARVNYSGEYYSTSTNVFGPTFSTGFQFEIRDKLTEFNLSYTYGLTRSSAIPTGATVTKDVNHGFAVHVLYDLDQ
jgi:hypothetical protein